MEWQKLEEIKRVFKYEDNWIKAIFAGMKNNNHLEFAFIAS